MKVEIIIKSLEQKIEQLNKAKPEAKGVNDNLYKFVLQTLRDFRFIKDVLEKLNEAIVSEENKCVVSMEHKGMKDRGMTYCWECGVKLK